MSHERSTSKPPRGDQSSAPARTRLLDGVRLLAWLDEHAGSGSLVRRAVYEGAAARVRRGDFDATEATR